jgi:hypothetical protein
MNGAFSRRHSSRYPKTCYSLTLFIKVLRVLRIPHHSLSKKFLQSIKALNYQKDFAFDPNHFSPILVMAPLGCILDTLD